MFAERARGRRAAILLALTLALSACGAPPVSVADYPVFGQVKAAFVNGQDQHVILVRALDRLALTDATLILPDATRIPAESIDTQPNPTTSSFGQGDRTFALVANQVQAIGGDVPMPPNPGNPPVTTTMIGQVASVALIRLPDLADYREIWQQAKIQVRLGLGSDSRTEMLPAPPAPDNRKTASPA
jgi:hypothetical protein